MIRRHHRRVEDDQPDGDLLEPLRRRNLEAHLLQRVPVRHGDFALLRGDGQLLLLVVVPALFARAGEVHVQHRERQVHREERSEDDEHDKVRPRPRRRGVHDHVHDVGPALHGDALEDGQPRPRDVVKVAEPKVGQVLLALLHAVLAGGARVAGSGVAAVRVRVPPRPRA